ncbi:ECF RNA polymerase sigma factor SigC [Paraconexibacter sp. AEG42_29]|uniref:ECF RNA polymerase sigma factor SigC n=1 Tax=Paraconexibacter sp. AEG42_29 TaxID=2997339 RepID=A0AAU7AWQ2_9ACTN
MPLSTDDARALRWSVEEPEAFGALYRAHVGPVLRYLRGRLGADLAEDAAHEVFLRAFRQRDRYDERHGTALPWLYGIAAHVVADHRRHEQRQLKVLRKHSHSQPSSEDAGGAAHVLDPMLVRALERLSLEDRETLLLNVWGELSYEETAAALGVPVGTIRSRLARARSSVKAELAHDDHTTGGGDA